MGTEFLFRRIFSLASLASRRLTILMFHRVLAEPDPLRPGDLDADEFRSTIATLAAQFEMMTVADAVEQMGLGALPRRACCVTFDDGYADNEDIALPILLNLGVPATFYVTTGYMNGGMMWNDRVIDAVSAWPEPMIALSAYGLDDISLPAGQFQTAQTILDRIKYLDFGQRDAITSALLRNSSAEQHDLMMSRDGVRRLYDAGMEIGGHTHTHPILARLEPDAVRDEITTNKEILESITGNPLKTFAYPNGQVECDFNASHASVLSDLGYAAAVTTMPGTVGDLGRPYEIPRFTPWSRTPWRFLALLARNYCQSPQFAADSNSANPP